MELCTGRGKKLQVNLAGKIYKIMDAAYDMAQVYVAEIKAGSKDINDVPDNLKPLVEELLKTK
jgi:hypothetical protein